MQKSNKNEIFMARVKNSNCLNFCTQVDPSKTRKAVYFFSSNMFLFSRKTNFSLSPSRIDGTGICRKYRESFESKSQIDQLTLTVKDLKMVSNLIVIAALEETAPGKAEILLNKLVISNDVAQTEDQVATRMRATGAHEGKSYPLLLTKLAIERYRVGFLV